MKHIFMGVLFLAPFYAFGSLSSVGGPDESDLSSMFSGAQVFDVDGMPIGQVQADPSADQEGTELAYIGVCYQRLYVCKNYACVWIRVPYWCHKPSVW